MADTREEYPAQADVALSDTVHVPSGERYCPSCDQSFDGTVSVCPQDGTNLIRIAGDADVIGKVVDNRFTIKSRIGGGGMGSVYRALQHSVGREVAVKLIHPRLSRDTVAVKRFLREAKLCSRLSHVGSVMVLDFGQCDTGELFMVMELLDGRTLSELLEREGKLPPAEVVNIARQVCASLEAAHSLRIVHRDLKPSNVMVVDQADGSQIVKVLDFGLAKSLAGDDSTVTQSGLMMGTPLYASPEVALGAQADMRSDLYSLGVMLFQLLSGTPPFAGDTPQSLLHQHATEPAPRLPDTVPETLRTVVAKLLQKDPDERYQTAAALSEALRDVAAGLDRVAAAAEPPTDEAPHAVAAFEPRDRRRMVPLLAGGLVVAIAVVALVVVRGGRAQDTGGRAAPGVSPADAGLIKPKPIEAASGPVTAQPDAGNADESKPVAAKQVDISFRTKPTGAHVVVDGERRCQTPCAVLFARGAGTAVVTLEKTGFRSIVHRFSVDRSHLRPVVELVAATRTVRRTRPRPARVRAKPAHVGQKPPPKHKPPAAGTKPPDTPPILLGPGDSDR